MAGAVTGLHTFGPDTGPEALSLLDGNYGLLTTGLNTLVNFSNSYIDSGAVNGIVITVAAPQVFAYVDGVILQVKMAATNTLAAVTINVNALGAKNIVNPDGSALVPGQMVAGSWVALQYEVGIGKFQLMGGGSAQSFKQLTVGAPAAGVALTVNTNDNTNAMVFNDIAGVPVNGFNVLFENNGVIVGKMGTGPATIAGGAVNDFGIGAQNGNPLKLGWSAGAGGFTPAITISGTGRVTVAAQTTTGAAGLTVNGLNNADTELVQSGLSAGQAFGLRVQAGTNGSDYAFLVNNAANSVNYLEVLGTGQILGGGPVAAALVDMTPDTGTFTGTLTGLTTSPTGTCTWTRIGKLVLLGLPINIGGVSNSVSFGMTGLPAAIQPATLTQWVPCAAMEDNSVVKTGTGVIITAGSGTLAFTLNGNSAGWTAANSKGTPASVQSQVIAYLLN